MGREDKNGWGEYKQLVLHQMEENSKRFDRMEELMTKMSADVTGLKVKAAVAGGIAGLVGTGLASLAVALLKA